MPYNQLPQNRPTHYIKKPFGTFNENKPDMNKRSKPTLQPFFLFIFLKITILTIFTLEAVPQELGVPAVNFEPETYVVHKAQSPIKIDGVLEDESWQNTEWTRSFVDIRGENAPKPRYNTRAKMLWDDDYFYIAAKLEEPHVWATITERDAVIFMDNNFEVFIDPTGDTHHYYELEVNAFGTIWDLMLTRPYRNGGRAIDAWDIKGLKVGIDIQGTLNDPTDIDEGWTVELAIPWDVLEEAAPGGKPQDGTQWRLNFSRVQWQTEIIDGKYVKKTDPETGEDLPEDNWSWSPQGLINMHYPEMWGYVQFSDEPSDGQQVEFEWNEIENLKWLMRKLYYRQVYYYNEHGSYANQPGELDFEELYRSLISENSPLPNLTILTLDQNYLMKLSSDNFEENIYIRNDSKIWTD